MSLTIKEFDEQLNLAVDSFMTEFKLFYNRYTEQLEASIKDLDKDAPKHLVEASLNNAMKKINDLDLEKL